jgi:hypothetical protein
MASSGTTMKCELNTPYRVGTEGIGGRGMVAGWASPETGHNWNEGFEAVLLLSTSGMTGPTMLVVEGTPYITDVQPAQDLTVYVNGHYAGFFRLTQSDDSELRVNIEPECWFHRNDAAVLKVVSHLPNSIRPIDVGDGRDRRQLGFSFHSLYWNKAEPVRSRGWGMEALAESDGR